MNARVNTNAYASNSVSMYTKTNILTCRVFIVSFIGFLRILYAIHCENLDDTRLKKYSNFINIRLKNHEETCSICTVNRNRIQLKPCNHYICIECCNRLIKADMTMTCPFCRSNVKQNPICYTLCTLTFVKVVIILCTLMIALNKFY